MQVQKIPTSQASAVADNAHSVGYPSVGEAVDAARRAIQPVTEAERKFEENHGVRFFGHNPQQAMVARFSDGLVSLRSSQPDSSWHLEISRGGSPAAVSAEGQQVEYRHSDGVVESYENQSGGFHHSLTVPSREIGEDGLLRLRMDVEGLTVAEDPSSPGDLCFTDGEGRAVAAYRGLKAWDVNGRELPATMHPNAAGFELAVNDRDAVYPVSIDPTFYNLEETLLTEMAGTGRSGDRFGSAVAVDGDTAVVTAPTASSTLTGGGRAYVFTRAGGVWSLQAELWLDDGTSSGEFGSSVDLDGDTLVVGAWKADVTPNGKQGRAYIFRRSGQTWTQQAKLNAPTPVSSGQFGYSVAVNGDDVAVGSYQGGVYVFRKMAGVWQFDSQLSGGPSAYGFGQSVALDGDTLLIGAPREAVGINSQVGAAYVFTRTGGIWNQSSKIASPTIVTEEHFGQAVALDGDLAVISAAYPDNTGAQKDRGAVAIFHRNPQNGWDQEYYSRLSGIGNVVHHVAISGESVIVAKGIKSPTSSIYQRSGTAWALKTSFDFGSSIAIDGSTLVLGAVSEQAAYVHEFDGTSWPLQQRLSMGNSREGAKLGSALAVQGDTVLVGAAGEPTSSGLNAGAVYVFVKASEMWQIQARFVSDSFDSTGPAHYFGSRVALDGDIAAVSSASDSYVTSAGVVTTNVGSVTVFTRSGSTWSQQQKLYASNFTSSDGFGSGLALRGDRMLIGSPSAKVGNGLNCGRVYWFQRNGTIWTEKASYVSNATFDNQQFGCAIAIDSAGTTAVIGASIITETASGLGYAAGSAFVYTFNGSAWSQRARLQTPAAIVGPAIRFGSAVSISGNTVLIGAPGVDLPSVSDPFGTKGGVGRCHIFTGSGASWTHQAALSPLDGDQSTGFGKALQLVGNTAAIGTAGSVELFTGSGATWTRQEILESSIDPTNTSFGSNLAMDGSLLAVGAPSIGRNILPIKRSYPALGAVEIFRVSTHNTTVAITQPAANPAALADTSLSLRFSASVDTGGVAGTPVIGWSKFSGPGSISFSNASGTDSFATFSQPGTYIVQCAAMHAGNTVTANRMVVVGTPSVMTFRQGVNAYRQETTTIREDQTNRNYGAAGEFLVGKVSTGTSGQATPYRARTLMSFDLMGLPANAIIQEISLGTTTSSTPGTGTVSDLELRVLPTTFYEGAGSSVNGSPGAIDTDSGVTWLRRTDAASNTSWASTAWSFSDHQGTTLLSTVPSFNAATETDTPKTFSSTPDFVLAAQTAIAAGRLSLVIRADASVAIPGDVNCARFYSDDAVNAAVRPQLRITYRTGLVPQIATITLTTKVAQPVSLSGLVTGAASLAWTPASGPGTASFSDPANPAGTVVFNQPGSYTVNVDAVNANGQVAGSVHIEVEPNLAFFAQWQEYTWPGETNAEIIASGKDPDGDGITNLLEWALHLDSTKPDTAQIALEIQGGLIEYRYTRRKTIPGEADFQVEWSDHLNENWSRAGVGEEIITWLTDTSESVLVTVPVGTGGSRFVRLGVSKP